LRLPGEEQHDADQVVIAGPGLEQLPRLRPQEQIGAFDVGSDGPHETTECNDATALAAGHSEFRHRRFQHDLRRGAQLIVVGEIVEIQDGGDAYRWYGRALYS